MRPVMPALLAAFALLAPPSLLAGSRPTDSQVRESYYRSYRYEKTQNYEDAVKALMPVYKAWPKGYTVNLRLGWLYYLSGKYANATEHYRTAALVSPTAIEAKLGVLLPLLAQERYQEAETVARQVLEKDPMNYYGNFRLAVALRMQKKTEQAVKTVSKMLSFYPTDLNFLAQQGWLYLASGQKSNAKRLFYNLLTLDPENVTAKQVLSKL